MKLPDRVCAALLGMCLQMKWNTYISSRAANSMNSRQEARNGAISAGANKSYSSGAPSVSAASAYVLLEPAIQYMVKLIKRKYLKFCFTSIQCNRQFGGQLHCDRNNVGPSLMITIGRYTGGDLFYYNMKNDKHNILTTKNRIIYFDGNNPHATLPYKGVRFSFVFFVITSVSNWIPQNAAFARCQCSFPSLFASCGI